MPADPFAVLNALLRAEAARQDRRKDARTEQDRATEPPVTPVRSEERKGRTD
ncbi:hypothetical protein ACFYU9_18325 [Streptomyces sp. NPDC004327]|uniref:hypothetical protein n=1 Tax=unclassified Streptomyces TaxID=2593676 RepID=UPI0036C94354